jgi:hypothetical protein
VSTPPPTAPRGTPAGPASGPGGDGSLFGAEMQLLLQCARVQLDRAHRARIAHLVEGSIDWHRMLEITLRHKMLPFVGTHLRGDPARIPAGFQQRIMQLMLENAQRMLRIVGELVEVRRVLEAAGVASVPYKGPVLGAQVYGSAALRQAGDLDLLIHHRDQQRARDALVSLGYRPRHTLTQGGEAFMVASRYSTVYDHDSAAEIELHWAFTNKDIALALSLEDLEPNLVPVPVGGATFSGFGAEDLLIILCVHGSKHRWDRLEWLCGVAEAVRRSPAINWPRLLDRATELGVRRMLLLGLLIAHDLLEAPVPSEVLLRARADATVVELARQVPSLLTSELEGEDADSLPTDIFRYKLRERRRDQVRFVLYRLTTPSRPESWSTVSIGPVLLPLHAFVRPFRLVMRLGPVLRRYLATHR